MPAPYNGLEIIYVLILIPSLDLQESPTGGSCGYGNVTAYKGAAVASFMSTSPAVQGLPLSGAHTTIAESFDFCYAVRNISVPYGVPES